MTPPSNIIPPTHEHNAPLAGLTARAAVLSVVFTFAIYLLTTKPGFVRINWVPYTSPPVQPFFILVLLVALNSLLARLRRCPPWLRPLTRAELFFIYAALAISMPMERGGYVIHYLTTGQYFANDANRWGQIFEQYPDWIVPKDQRVIQQWMEGSESGAIPWAAWRGPLTVWFLFQMVLVFTVLCLVSLFRKQWSENERLGYPLLRMPLEVAGRDTDRGMTAGMLRNPLTWIGFTLAAAYNGLNIAHAYFPGVPGIERYVPLDNSLTEGWLRYLRPMSLSFSLEIWGLAYLISGEVLFSGWFFYLFMKMVKVFGLSAGYRGAGFPFYQEVSSGGYIALALALIWVARPHLKAALQSALGIRRDPNGNEAMPAGWLVIGLVLGTAAMVWFWAQLGLKPVLTLIFLLSMFIFTLVAARVRAEAGPPVAWCHPYGYDLQMPYQLLGSRFLKSVGGEKGMALFGILFWIGRTAYPHQVAQYVVDGLQLAHHGNMRRTHLVALMLGICAVALGITFWYHLDVGYTFGQILIGSRSGEQSISWGFNWSRGEYTVLRQGLDFPASPDFTRMIAYACGLGFTALLSALRMRLSNFPFHPLGFLFGTLYGESTPYWFPFLVAWSFQRLFLRYGGFRMYRRFVPLFLGLALGHILIGGFLWRIVINYFIDPAISKRYYLNLGG